MTYLAVKTNVPSWKCKPYLRPGAIGGGAFRKLNIQENALSMWRVDPEMSPDLIDDVAVALFAAGERPEPFELVWIDQHLFDRLGLLDRGIVIKETLGNTPANNIINSFHVNIENIDLRAVTSLAIAIARSARSEARQRPFSKSRLVTLLRQYVNDSKIDRSLLKDAIAAVLLT